MPPTGFHAFRTAATVAVATLALGCAIPAHTADPAHSVFTPIKGPDCITDTTGAFVTRNIAPDVPVFPYLPNEGFYLVVRYLGEDSLAGTPEFDFSRFPASYAWPPLRGSSLTGFAVPQPRPPWQRARRSDATLDTSSAFQLHCADAGSFINTWAFPAMGITGGGPHAVYGFSFNDPPPQPVFDRDPGTEFVLQASVEIPWFAIFPPAGVEIVSAPVGQVSLFAYLRHRPSRKVFALLLGVFDSRYAATPPYEPYASHDTFTPFVSQPLGGVPAFASPSPYSQAFTGIAWSGLRFYRGHVTQAQFGQAIAALNDYCREHRSLRYCDATIGSGAAFGADPLDYEITDFGVLHEVFRGVPAGNLSMAVHLFDVGAWNAR